MSRAEWVRLLAVSAVAYTLGVAVERTLSELNEYTEGGR